MTTQAVEPPKQAREPEQPAEAKPQPTEEQDNDLNTPFDLQKFWDRAAVNFDRYQRG